MFASWVARLTEWISTKLGRQDEFSSELRAPVPEVERMGTPTTLVLFVGEERLSMFLTNRASAEIPLNRAARQGIRQRRPAREPVLDLGECSTARAMAVFSTATLQMRCFGYGHSTATHHGVIEKSPSFQCSKERTKRPRVAGRVV